jgi:Type II CAAX prenyl endopeptidase Rce1-like
MSSSEPASETARPVNWLAGAEAAGMFVLIVAYIWWLRFRYPYAWVPMLLLIFAAHLYHGETLATLGFRRSHPAHALARLSAFLALLALALLTLGMGLRSIRTVTLQGAFLSFLMYCLWGLFQQYILNGYFVNRFSDFLPGHPHAVPLLAAAFFSLAHLPNWFLMMATLVGGYVCARIYLQYRNLYFLGMAHGVVGFLLYLVVPDTISHHLYVGPKWFSM